MRVVLTTWTANTHARTRDPPQVSAVRHTRLSKPLLSTRRGSTASPGISSVPPSLWKETRASRQPSRCTQNYSTYAPARKSGDAGERSAGKAARNKGQACLPRNPGPETASTHSFLGRGWHCGDPTGGVTHTHLRQVCWAALLPQSAGLRGAGRRSGLCLRPRARGPRSARPPHPASAPGRGSRAARPQRERGAGPGACLGRAP